MGNSVLDKIPKPLDERGFYSGRCYNDTCNSRSFAVYYNKENRFYYCKSCAEVLNKENNTNFIKGYANENKI